MSSTTDTVIASRDPSAGLTTRAATLGAEIGPLRHLSVERARLAELQWQHFDVRRLGATVGAVISGVDITSDLPDEVIAELRRALFEYKVIFFRDQPLTAERHVAFARRFGELEVHPFIPGNSGTPELVRFEKSAEVGGYENGWHHDVTWRAVPSMGAVLHAIHVPASGGDTLFSDMYAAFDGLEPEMQQQLCGLDALHDFMRAFGRQVPPERRAEMREKYPTVQHPVVPVHPETGRRYLYVNRFFTDSIVGLDAAESDAMMTMLFRQAELVEYQCRFQWEPDSVAFWDNRAVQHYASSDYWPEMRIMERASIIGTAPSR
jgi:alpha-ketoglutarate-dependent sulfate ester dioxygenase